MESSRGVAELAVAPWRGRDDVTVLVGIDDEALVAAVGEQPGIERVDRAFGEELAERLAQPGAGWLVIILRTGAGVDDAAGLARLEQALRPGGVATLVAPQRDDELHARMHARFIQVSRVAVPGDSGLDYVYRGRRPAPVAPAGTTN